MLKILNTDQIKEWDAYTIEHEPISSIDLMERACKAFVNWFTEKFNATKKVGVICGAGNNGGDGLGVARLLSDWGFAVKVWVIKANTTESEDFKVNLQRLPEKVEVEEIRSNVTEDLFKTPDILIDAIFGSGLSRPVEGIFEVVIGLINKADAIRVAIDIPSGLFADKATSTTCIQADYTVTFQAPKLAFLLPMNEHAVGEWHVVDIGLSKLFRKKVKATHFLLDKKSVTSLFPGRRKFSHKGDYGKALLIAGSYGKMGASVLAARAAMRSGVGLLTVHVPKAGYIIIQTSVPEAMASVDESESSFSSVVQLEGYSAIGIGPGIGVEPQTLDGVRSVLENSPCPIVIDADALNILAANRELLHIVPAHSILTPHPGELKRLIGEWKDDFEKLEKARAMASDTNSIIVIKGANSAIVAPGGDVYFNTTGNPGMATGGSGDVLTGILTSLLAQEIEPLNAALIGVFVHGLAGDLALFDTGPTSLIASDLISAIPAAFRQLSNKF